MNNNPSNWLSHRPALPISSTPTGVNWGGFRGLVKQYPGSSAAYSLRKIGSGPVVRLRRSSDSAESDFAAVELAGSVTGSERATNGDFSTGDLTGWSAAANFSVNGGNQLVCDGLQAGRVECTQTAICPETGDENYYKLSFNIISCSDFTDAGIRLASNSFSTCEFSDMGINSAGQYSILINTSLCTNKEFDIFCQIGVTLTIDNISMKEYQPNAAELWAFGTPLSSKGFVGDNAWAYVTTWYDQSGSGNDAVQATAAAQPRLITAGVVETDNGKPAIVFDGVDDTLTATMSGFAHTDAFCVMGTADTTFYFPTNRDEGAGWAGWLADDGSASTTIIGGQYSSGSNVLRVNGADQSPATRDDVHTLLSTDTQLLVSDIDAATANWTEFNWGADYATAEYGGRLQEWIIYGSDQSANRVGIEANINDHYGIY